MDWEKVPEELKQLRQWVCWRWEDKKKMPVNARTGGNAQSNNPDTWTDFETAVKAAPQYNGIGFMFKPPYFGVDLDHAKDDIKRYKNGDYKENIVAEFIHTLGSYAEFSQSGNGIHIICKGVLPPGGRRKSNVEMYQSGRYFIMTGNVAADYTEIVDCTETIKPLHEKYVGGGQDPVTESYIPEPLPLDAGSVLAAARRSKQGYKFDDLYNGRWQNHYKSQSEADMGFCMMLAFWCRKDIALMDGIFRSSGLMRKKWEQKRGGKSYGQITLEKAIRDTQTVYEPAAKYEITIKRNPPPPDKLYSLDDMGNSQRLADAYADSLRCLQASKAQWYFYDERRWRLDDRKAVVLCANEVIEDMRKELPRHLAQPNIDPEEMVKQFNKHEKYSRSYKAKVAMIQEAQPRLPVTREEFDTDNDLVCLYNGVLDSRSGEFMPHSFSHYMTRMIPVEYRQDADCPRWKAFLQQIFDGDAELIRYIQKAVGYTLTGDISEQCAFFCWGDGRNGKSTFLETIASLMGDYAKQIQPETILVNNRSSGGASSDIARLHRARFVTCAEPNEGVRLNEGIVKQITGDDRITARFQFEREFEFKPNFKFWMGTNHKPIIRGTDTGIWRRIHLIPFQVTIPEEDVDKNLPYLLRRELPGILIWAIEGCLLWRKEGLEKPSAVEAAVKEYRNEMDVLSAWLDDCCVLDNNARETPSDLYQCYAQWADENNEYKMGNRKFILEIAKRFEKKPSHGKKYYIGIKILDEYRPYQINPKWN